MQWWDQLSTKVKAMLTLVAALGATLTALQGPLEPVTPAWRGWVRSYISDQVSDIIKPLTLQLAIVQDGQLETRLSTINLSLGILTDQASDIELRLRETPNDPLLIRRKNDIQRNITQLNTELINTSCQLEVVRGARKSC